MFEPIRLRKAKEKLASARPTSNINFRLYLDERQVLETACKNAGKCLSEYIRECVFSSLSIPEVSKAKKNDAQDSASESGSEPTVESLNRPGPGKDAPIAENSSENSPPVSEQVAKRTGHKRGCECFACVRLREMISATGRKGRGRRKPRE